MSRTTLRDHVLAALDDLGVCVSRDELAAYLRAKLGAAEREVRMQHLIPLVEREVAAYRRGPGARQVWICHPLTARHLETMWGIFARSDWPLEWRIETMRGGQIRYLKRVIRLCELAAAATPDVADPLALKRLCRNAARGLAGGETPWDMFELDRWKTAAQAALADIEPLDAAELQQAVAVVAQLPAVEQLYGSPENLVHDLNRP